MTKQSNNSNRKKVMVTINSTTREFATKMQLVHMNSSSCALAALKEFYINLITYVFGSRFLHKGLDYTDTFGSRMYHHSDTPGHKHLGKKSQTRNDALPRNKKKKIYYTKVPKIVHAAG